LENRTTTIFDHLVYLRVFEGCNLHCEHCFIPSNPKKMSINQIKAIPEHLNKFAKRGDIVLLQWHGGEPTARGINFFKESLDFLSKESDFVLKNEIQTNLISYNEQWKEIYLKYFNGKIGVSWDPQIRFLNKNGSMSNTAYEQKFWDNFEKLKSDGIEAYFVITGTKLFFETFKNPFSLFAFLEDKGINNIHIERLTKTGYAKENWEKLGVNNEEYSNYMIRLARAYEIYKKKERNCIQPLHISPLDGLLESMTNLFNGIGEGYGCLSGKCDTNFHTIDANGYRIGCTALTTDQDGVHNEHTHAINMFDLKMVRKLRQIDCHNCKFKTICSSGCLATSKVDESSECSGGRQLFNEIEKIILYNVENNS